MAVKLEGGRVAEVEIIRGAPCGATWQAARRIVGLPAEEAVVRFGLETQIFCTADPSAWDPIKGYNSPVHFAGHVHQAALERALKGLLK